MLGPGWHLRPPVSHTAWREVWRRRGILGASWLLTSGLSDLIGQHVVWAKLVVDSALFGVSFLAQKHWVFASRVPHPDEVPEPATLRP
jgi:hypothetical protein